MKRLVIHLISESSGQTVKHAANTALSKFSDIEVKKYHWPMTRNEDLLDEVFKKIRKSVKLMNLTKMLESVSGPYRKLNNFLTFNLNLVLISKFLYQMSTWC